MTKPRPVGTCSLCGRKIWSIRDLASGEGGKRHRGCIPGGPVGQRYHVNSPRAEGGKR